MSALPEPRQSRRRLQRRVRFGTAWDGTRPGYGRWLWTAFIPGMKYEDVQYGGRPLIKIPVSRWRKTR